MGSQQVHKIIGSQIVKISQLNTSKITKEVSEKGYNVITIIIGIFAAGALPFMYFLSNGEFRISFKTIVFIPIIIWAIYDLFFKAKTNKKNAENNLVNVYSFNSFLKTINTPEDIKIKYKDIKSLYMPFTGKNSIENDKYLYGTYIKFKNGNKRLILESNDYESILEASKYLSKEAKISLTH